MSKQDNIQTQQDWGEAVNSGHLEALRKLVSPDCIEHDPAPNQGPGAQGYIDMFKEMRTAFPDLAVAVEHLTADEDTVAIAYTLTGTHQGDLMGNPATGKKVKARGVQIARFEEGLLVERWGSSDQLGILQQLGIFDKSRA